MYDISHVLVHQSRHSIHEHWVKFWICCVQFGPIAHFSKRAEDPSWYNEYNRADIAKGGPIWSIYLSMPEVDMS